MHEPIPPHVLDNFCVSRDFTRLPKFISKIQYKNGTDLKDKLKEFLSNNQHATHANHINTCMVQANLLCGRLGSSTSQDPCTAVFILDIGVSFGFTPFKINFIDYVKCNIPVKDVTEVKTVIGIGKKIHKFVDAKVKDVFLPCISCHLPTTDAKFFSPQNYHQLHGAHSIFKYSMFVY